MDFDKINLDFLKGKTEEVKRFVSKNFGEISNDEASKIAQEPKNMFNFVQEKFGTSVDDFKRKFDGFNFDEFKDGVTFDEVKGKVGEVFDRLKK